MRPLFIWQFTKVDDENITLSFVDRYLGLHFYAGVRIDYDCHFKRRCLILNDLKNLFPAAILRGIKNYKPCKPDFVLRIAAELLPFIWMLHCCNILSAYPQASGEQPSNACLLGISSRKVYPQLLLPITIVRSYRTFSPLPRQSRGGNFLWHFLSPGRRQDPIS